MRSSRSGRFVVLLASLLPIAGCAGLGLPEADRSSGRVRVAVSVEELPGDDVWRVGYVLDRPVAGVEFVRSRNAFRRDRWGVAVREAEAEWHLDDERERLCFTRPARAFSVGFRTWADPLPKDYELNVTFSEGSRLLNTGHLLVRPLAACGPGDAARPGADAVHRFDFRTTEGRAIRVLGLSGSGELAWQPDPEDLTAADTYVYFGDLEAVEGEVATVVLDPGLPPWMKAEMAEVVPGLVERFSGATGAALPFRPLLFVAWGGPDGSGTSFSGGTLPGLLLASAEGPGWLSEGAGVRREWLHRIAHEVFHLWDGELYRPDEESEWLSEAAADHFAVDATIAFGARTELDARRWLVERANDCLVRLEGRTLAAAAGGGDYAGWYSCGAVALAAAEGALRSAEPPADLARLFRRLFEHSAATGSYGTAAFLGGLRELHAAPDAVADLRRLIRTGGVSDGDRFLQRLLAHAGVAADRVPPEEALADPSTLREMVGRAVGRCWCGTGDAATCDAVETGRGAASVAGEALDETPLAAWERLRSAVARASALPVVLDGQEVSLFCSADSFDPTWNALLQLPGSGGLDGAP